MKLFHGGAPGLWRGDRIDPNMAHTRFHEGCAQCAAQKEGAVVLGFDPPTPSGFVYATSDMKYARYYASRYGSGSLYEVTLDSGSEASTEDPFPTWRAPSALVVRVVERHVTLTMREREALFVRWGGTPAEFRQMVRGVARGAPLEVLP